MKVLLETHTPTARKGGSQQEIRTRLVYFVVTRPHSDQVVLVLGAARRDVR
jgi:hypothetical protein